MYQKNLFLLAYLISLSQGQGQDDACWSCPVGDLFRSGFDLLIEDAIVPAVGTLQNLFPNTVPVPGKTDSSQGFVVPQQDPEEQKPSNPGSDNFPGQWRNPEPDIEVIANPADDEKCDPNGVGVSICYIPLISS